jgi:hypothetical protein
MSDKTETKTAETEKKELVFVCKFCGETKPFGDLVIMRQYYPPITACKSCAKATKNAP